MKKISALLIPYWTVFLILATIAVYVVDYRYSFVDILLECFALQLPTMRFCWYIYFYIFVMLTLPLLTKVMSKNIHNDLILLLTFAYILTIIMCFVAMEEECAIFKMLNNIRFFFPVVLTGYIFARYRLFEKMHAFSRRLIKHDGIFIMLCFIVLCVVPMGRFVEPVIQFEFDKLPDFSLNLDVLYVPIFTYVFACLYHSLGAMKIKLCLSIIGKYSMLMWFFSCIFFNNSKTVFQPILYLVKDPLLVLIWGCLLCFIPSYFLSKIIGRLIEKIR